MNESNTNEYQLLSRFSDVSVINRQVICDECPKIVIYFPVDCLPLQTLGNPSQSTSVSWCDTIVVLAEFFLDALWFSVKGLFSLHRDMFCTTVYTVAYMYEVLCLAFPSVDPVLCFAVLPPTPSITQNNPHARLLPLSRWVFCCDWFRKICKARTKPNNDVMVRQCLHLTMS